MNDMDNYWNIEIYKKNIYANSHHIKKTIDDLSFNDKKVMICGRGVINHPNFFPRFSTPTTNIDSNIYVVTDHSPLYEQFITRKGIYALCTIVDPIVYEKIISIGGEVYWFSDFFMKYAPNIPTGKFPKGNSGLSSISLASYLGAKYILLSGITLSGEYAQFLEGKDIVFTFVKNNQTKIFSLDGILAEKISYDAWCKL